MFDECTAEPLNVHFKVFRRALATELGGLWVADDDFDDDSSTLTGKCVERGVLGAWTTE